MATLDGGNLDMQMTKLEYSPGQSWRLELSSHCAFFLPFILALVEYSIAHAPRRTGASPKFKSHPPGRSRRSQLALFRLLLHFVEPAWNAGYPPFPSSCIFPDSLTIRT